MAARTLWTVYAGLWRRVRTIVAIVFAGLALAFIGLWLAEAQGLRAPQRDNTGDFMIALMLIGVANLVAALDPEVVVIGGGVSAAGDRLLEPARDALRRTLVGADHRRIPGLVAAELGPRAGMIGAALLVS